LFFYSHDQFTSVRLCYLHGERSIAGRFCSRDSRSSYCYGASAKPVLANARFHFVAFEWRLMISNLVFVTFFFCRTFIGIIMAAESFLPSSHRSVFNELPKRGQKTTP
jgi:hypothetical protein